VTGMQKGKKASEGSTFIHSVLLSVAYNGMESIWRKKEGKFGLKSA